MSAGASKNARLPEVQIQEHTHAGVAPSAPARYNRLIHFQGRSSVVEQRPFKPKVVGSIPTAPTNHLVNSCVPISNSFSINGSGERIHTEQSRVSRNPGYCSTAEPSSYRFLMGPACALRPFSCGAPQ